MIKLFKKDIEDVHELYNKSVFGFRNINFVFYSKMKQLIPWYGKIKFIDVLFPPIINALPIKIDKYLIN